MGMKPQPRPRVEAGGLGGLGNSFHTMTNTKREQQCGIAAFCPKKKSLGVKAASKTVIFNHLAGEVDGELAAETSHVESGFLNGKLVTVLVDTSSRMSAVQADLVTRASWKREQQSLSVCMVI